MYIVVQCPFCKRWSIARYGQRTRECPYCGRRIPIMGEHKVFSSRDEAAHFIATRIYGLR